MSPIVSQSLKMQYDQILQDAKRIYEVYYHRRGGTDLTWERRMAELLSAVMEFIAARKDMTDVYVEHNFTFVLLTSQALTIVKLCSQYDTEALSVISTMGKLFFSLVKFYSLCQIFRQSNWLDHRYYTLTYTIS